MQTIIQTERLVLRPFVLADAPAVQRLAGSAQVADTTLMIPHPYPDGAAEGFIRQSWSDRESGEHYVFAIRLRDREELCGAMGLKMTPKHERAELGYWIGVPYWNKGYATEAGRAILRYAFETLKLHSVNAHHFARNPASGRVLKKIGMSYEGRLRQHVKKSSRFEDLECYSILKSEWFEHG
ncbi:MAG: GNAT family N-acetyltransferase [Verrucomicrobia subdivision 3 bacterium]|nr:GNAT family N-acetyltransferase [Limisphaerales bacterium]